MTQSWKQPLTVAVVGGGLAGLAAACALTDAGFRVTVFEKRSFLGGRATSYEHPGTGEVVDNCQHVLFGCCTNLIAFYRRMGVADKIRWYDSMTFVEPGGRASVLQSSALPAPLHTAPSFLRFPFLTARDKLAIARAMVPLTLTALRDTGESFREWLQQHGQTEGAVQRFWKPILVSALSEELDRMSVSYAAQVVRESMKAPSARHMGVPTVPLRELYHAVEDYIGTHGGEVQLRSPVDGLCPESSRVALRLKGGEARFDYLVLALPFNGLAQVLPESPEAQPLREKLGQFEPSPITGIHLWFDRQISELDHAVLLDGTIQWMFHKSKLRSAAPASRRHLAAENEGRSFSCAAGKESVAPGVPARHAGTAGHDFSRAEREPNRSGALAPDGNGSYVELVVSSSKNLVEKSRAEIVELAVRELREFFPAAREANLVKSTVIKEIYATYSPRPGIDNYRPGAETLWPNVFLAGDWTATGWPATMEGAVRSGYLAAEALARAAGLRNATFLVPDLAATGFMRLFR